MTSHDPNKIVWYIEAKPKNGPVASTGSAVAIRLRKKAADGLAPNPAKTYLLTCAHVLREKDGNGEVCSGGILAWRPGVGCTAGQAKVVRIKTDIKQLALETAVQQNAADDWIILEFDDLRSASAADAVCTWSDPAEQTNCVVFGYPAGRSSFADNGIVKPTGSSCTVRSLDIGVICFNGTDARPGQSGGGVFRQHATRADFVGIHRDRVDDRLQLHGVAAVHIRNVLFEQGFEVAPCLCDSQKPDGSSGGNTDLSAQEINISNTKVDEQLQTLIVQMNLLKSALKSGEYSQASESINRIAAYFDGERPEFQRISDLVSILREGWLPESTPEALPKFRQIVGSGFFGSLEKKLAQEVFDQWFAEPPQGPIIFSFNSKLLEENLLSLMTQVRDQRIALPKNKQNPKAKSIIDRALQLRLNGLRVALVSAYARLQSRIELESALDSIAIGLHLFERAE